MARSENGRERRKRKERVVNLKRKQRKARTEKITLKRELHGLLKAQG